MVLIFAGGFAGGFVGSFAGSFVGVMVLILECGALVPPYPKKPPLQFHDDLTRQILSFVVKP
jgi:hypothetical protein